MWFKYIEGENTGATRAGVQKYLRVRRSKPGVACKGISIMNLVFELLNYTVPRNNK